MSTAPAASLPHGSSHLGLLNSILPGGKVLPPHLHPTQCPSLPLSVQGTQESLGLLGGGLCTGAGAAQSAALSTLEEGSAWDPFLTALWPCRLESRLIPPGRPKMQCLLPSSTGRLAILPCLCLIKSLGEENVALQACLWESPPLT